ncbi:MAG TPA: CopG family transcriptional regulator [Candidatus Limnocylindria bacterium]
MKRTQIYLDDTQAAHVAQRARQHGTTSSHVIREAIDRYLAEPQDDAQELARFRAVVDATFGIAPYLPPGDEYVEELRGADRARQDEIERRWRG